ncbi:LOW QUALITY PROTEIN: hypothetical protein HID58_007264, partial [Brassica napus]
FPKEPSGIDLKSMVWFCLILRTFNLVESQKIHKNFAVIYDTQQFLDCLKLTNSPYSTSMGVYYFKTRALMNLLTQQYSSSNDAAIRDHDVQVRLHSLKMIDTIISHGCFLRLQECSFQRSIFGDWSRLYYGVELQDTLMLGTDYYQTESGIVSLLAEGKVPIGIGRETKIRKCIIDKNAKIDMQAMKTILLEIPSLARLFVISMRTSTAASYSKFVSREIRKGTPMEFQRIFELKGLKKADQQSICDDFNKHGPRGNATSGSNPPALPLVITNPGTTARFIPNNEDVVISDCCKSLKAPSPEFSEYIKQRRYDLHDVQAYVK